MTVDRTISFGMRRIADSWLTEINYVPDCVLALIINHALWEGPQILLAKAKDANGQDWYILGKIYPVYLAIPPKKTAYDFVIPLFRRGGIS